MHSPPLLFDLNFVCAMEHKRDCFEEYIFGHFSYCGIWCSAFEICADSVSFRNKLGSRFQINSKLTYGTYFADIRFSTPSPSSSETHVSVGSRQRRPDIYGLWITCLLVLAVQAIAQAMGDVRPTSQVPRPVSIVSAILDSMVSDASKC